MFLQGDQRIDIFSEDFNPGRSYSDDFNNIRALNDRELERLYEVLLGTLGESLGQVLNLIICQPNIFPGSYFKYT
jgi:hypothetical protein